MAQRTPEIGESSKLARHGRLSILLAALALAGLPSCRGGGAKNTSTSQPATTQPAPSAAAKRQQAAAAALGIPKELVLDLGDSVTMRLALIPPGRFLMGSPRDEVGRWDERPKVTIPKVFYMGVHSVTQGQWKAVMGTEPWKGQVHVLERADCPATWVYARGAADFCAALRRRTGRLVRLPTEAEREYACRAGSKTRFSYGDDPEYAHLGEYAWYDQNAWDVGEEYAHPVGRKKPNDWGLYDMLGNVWELCWDRREEYMGALQVGMEDPNVGVFAWRGNSFFRGPEGCRSAAGSPAWFDEETAGFRVVVALDPNLADAPVPEIEPDIDANEADWRRKETPKDVLSVVAGSNEFAADLYARLAAKEKGNLLFSPGGIEAALAMTYAGAAGDTAAQMAKAMHFTLPPEELHAGFGRMLERLNHPLDKRGGAAGGRKSALHADDPNWPAYELVIANALWGQKGCAFKPAFINLLHKNYSAAPRVVDFAQVEQAAKTLSDWVAKETRGRIKELVQRGDLRPQTLFALTNAVYFKSGWAKVFPKEATKDGPFALAGGETVTVPMMHLHIQFAFYRENDDLQMLELPYARGELSMLVFLPKKGVSLEAMEKTLTAANLEKWRLQENDWRNQFSADITMPRFAFSSRLALPEVLREMGMIDAFIPDKADLSGILAPGIAGTMPVFLDAAIHEAVISVDEEGTEAAAATVVGGMFGEPELRVFTADHPFVFLIRHNATGLVLFMGRVANPK